LCFTLELILIVTWKWRKRWKILFLVEKSITTSSMILHWISLVRSGNLKRKVPHIWFTGGFWQNFTSSASSFLFQHRTREANWKYILSISQIGLCSLAPYLQFSRLS
jgi:hypothetical protein